MKKENITLLIVCLVLIATMVGYVAYSIIAMGVTNGEQNIMAETSNGLVFTAAGGEDITSKISDVSMAEGKEEDVIVLNTNQTLNITLDTDAQKGICCTYEINWVWDKTENTYTQSDGANDKEFMIKGSFQTKADEIAPGESTEAFEDTQLNNYSTEPQKLYSGTICNSNKTINEGALSESVTQTYTLETTFYNLKDVNQDALKGKYFKGHIRVSNIVCQKQES